MVHQKLQFRLCHILGPPIDVPGQERPKQYISHLHLPFLHASHCHWLGGQNRNTGSHLDAFVHGDEDIGRLDIPMHHLPAM